MSVASDMWPPFARTQIASNVIVLTTSHPQPKECAFLFVTRVLGGVLDGEEYTHTAANEALAMHCALAEWCRAGLDLDKAS